MSAMKRAWWLTPALLALITAASASAQTSDAGIPVVGTHTTDEVFPTLVRDGQGGAYIGFQTGVQTGPSTYEAVVHIVRLRPDATADPEWTPAEVDDLLFVLGRPTVIAAGGEGVAWAAGHYQQAGQFFMVQADANGVLDPPVVVSRPETFVAGDMQGVLQADGQTLMLHTSYSSSLPGLRVDRVTPAGASVAATLELPFPQSSAPVRIDHVYEPASGTTIVALQGWSGAGGDAGTGYDLHAIKLLADGSPAWSPATRPVCIVAGSLGPARVATDGAGGAFFAWSDDRSPGSNPDIYVTRLLADGSVAPGWPTSGRLVGVTTAAQQDPHVVADDEGGVWVVWTDYRTGVANLYYTHLRGSGLSAPGFSISGRALSAASGARVDARAVTDGAGGFLVAWRDARSGTSLDVYGQHVLFDGSFAPGLAVEGEPICTNESEQQDLALLDVGFNTAIVAWRDSRTGSAIVYASPMPVGNSGLDVPGRSGAGLALAPAGANPTRGPLEWVVKASGPGPIMVGLRDVAGRAIETRIVPAEPGGVRIRFAPPRPGLYFVTATAAGRSLTRRAVSLR